jgi:hypothetical protein
MTPAESRSDSSTPVHPTLYINLFADADSRAPFTSAHMSAGDAVDELATSAEMGFGPYQATLKVETVDNQLIVAAVNLSAEAEAHRQELRADERQDRHHAAACRKPSSL